jgi:peptidoglycan/xylan/chitin deacetylase (PgdA/CDA1 family)
MAAITGWMALTFDDGPSVHRPATLRTLRAAGVPATFFDVGLRVAANPQFAGFQARQGHLVLNHTWSHPRLTGLTADRIGGQLRRTEDAFREAGAPIPFPLLRPPFGEVDAGVAAALTALGYHWVNWDVVGADWDVATTAGHIRDTVTAAFRPGLVILVHDGTIDSAAGPAATEALPEIIAEAHRQGYRFGVLDPDGAVVPAAHRDSGEPIPGITAPVPYLPMAAHSAGLEPPAPSVTVDPAAEL